MEKYNGQDEGNVEIWKNPRYNVMSMFNRSFTFQSSPAFESPKMFYDRNGSMKKLYDSSFESIATVGNSLRGRVKKLCSVFEKPPLQPSNSVQSLSSLLSKAYVSDIAMRVSSPYDATYFPGTEDRVVVYFTSLRGVRRTFIDCSYVLMILKAFRIELDERDISMHMAYKKELLDVLGEKSVTLPQVFIKGKHIGGADVIRQLHEDGELARMLKEIPVRRVIKACDECGDVRFVPCYNCSGSRKVFDEDEDQVRRCPDCNENGIIQCQICSVS